jgi:hypothetical protein
MDQRPCANFAARTTAGEACGCALSKSAMLNTFVERGLLGSGNNRSERVKVPVVP